jgi:DNA-binding GntR family transcriptional regulator
MKVAQKIRLAIEDDIRDGRLLPGDPVNEAELISRYKVSRTPVREALLQLHAQGLLASLPRGGMVVAKMDLAQLLSMWELLAELEGLCARWAADRMTLSEREELAAMHRDAQSAVDADDMETWKHINRRFHETLYAGCRNPYLRQEILHMRSRTGAYLDHSFAAVGNIRTSWDGHASLIEAILRRDGQAANAAMVWHLSPGQGVKSLPDLVASLPKELLSDR